MKSHFVLEGGGGLESMDGNYRVITSVDSAEVLTKLQVLGVIKK